VAQQDKPLPFIADRKAHFSTWNLVKQAKLPISGIGVRFILVSENGYAQCTYLYITILYRRISEIQNGLICLAFHLIIKNVDIIIIRL